jgi:hypothetical protein
MLDPFSRDRDAAATILSFLPPADRALARGTSVAVRKTPHYPFLVEHSYTRAVDGMATALAKLTRDLDAHEIVITDAVARHDVRDAYVKIGMKLLNEANTLARVTEDLSAEIEKGVATPVLTALQVRLDNIPGIQLQVQRAQVLLTTITSALSAQAAAMAYQIQIASTGMW